MGKVSAGHWLSKRWSDLGYSASSLARVCSVSRRTLTRIAAGQRVKSATAECLAGPLKLNAEALRALTESWEVDADELDAIVSGVPPDGEMGARLREMGE